MGKRVWKHDSTYKDSTGKHRVVRLYRIWHGMIDRCTKPNRREYKYYGGKGVTVCKEWLSYDAFYEWAMKNGYEDSLTIDRENTYGNYEPANCRWVTQEEQKRNTSRNVYIDGKIVSELARECGLSSDGINYRIQHGIPLNTQKLKQVRMCEGMTLHEISKMYEVKYQTVCSRWNRGVRTIEELTKPLYKRS